MRALRGWIEAAAVGFAEYDGKQDTSVTDVFKRADQKMYEDKKKMKG